MPSALRTPYATSLRYPRLGAMRGGFSPASLFVNGEQGFWYDPSDLSTLFQDSAGTTPVTAVEQPVGLILDKSQGLTLGSEALPALSSFAVNLFGTWAQSGGNWVFSDTVGGQVRPGVSSSTTLTAGWYKAVIVIASATGATNVRIDGIGPDDRLFAAGTHTFYFRADAAAPVRVRLEDTSSSIGDGFAIKSFSIKSLPGYHASQSTSASRPVLSARYNLLTQTEDFLTGWAQNGLVTTGMTNVTTAPNGTQTADQLVESNTTGTHIDYRSVSGSKADTISVAARANTRSVLTIGCNDNTSGNWSAAAFNLSAGTAATAQSAGTFSGISSITPLGSGWYRCTLSVTSSGNAVGQIKFGVSDTTTPTFGSWADYSYDGDGTSGIYIWGADLRVTNDGVGIPAYQRVAAATDYDTSGFPLYLKFDGTDDSLSTASIDFSATDKMSVFAGVRKLSDAAAGVVTELSSNINSNNGAFIFAPGSYTTATGSLYHTSSKGTVIAPLNSTTTFASPITNVISALFDIAGDKNTIRINGLQNAQSTDDQGTGNYGNYPLYIGRRGGTTLPYNGRLYSLIVRGAQSTDAQIASTEAWVNGKTGAY